jgi:hypothetical protein
LNTLLLQAVAAVAISTVEEVAQEDIEQLLVFQ